MILAVGVLMFIINIVHTHRKEPKAPLDPWDARTLEWMTTSPPKEHNFDALPTVHALDEFFHRKYEDVGEGDHHDLQRVATAEEILAEQEANADHHIHLPSPSYWPLVLALALPIIAFGVIYNRLIGDRRRGDPAPRRLRLGARAVRRRRLRLRPAERRRGPGRRTGDGREPVMSRTERGGPPATPPEEKTPGHGAPDLGNEPSSPERGGDRGDRRDPHGRGARARAERRGAAAGRLQRAHGDARRRRTGRGGGPSRGAPRHDRAVQQQDGHVAVPRLRVPLVRRPDQHVHAVPRAPLRAASAPTRSTTSRSRRCPASCC